MFPKRHTNLHESLKRHTNLYESLENASKRAFKTSSNIYDEKQPSGGVLLRWNWKFRFIFSGNTSCELKSETLNYGNKFELNHKTSSYQTVCGYT